MIVEMVADGIAAVANMTGIVDGVTGTVMIQGGKDEPADILLRGEETRERVGESTPKGRDTSKTKADIQETRAAAMKMFH